MIHDPLAIVIISDIVTFMLSMLITLFIAGVRWGTIQRDIMQLKQDVAEIKGMFVIKLRSDHIDKD